MLHVSAACNPAFHTTSSYYLSADTTAFMQMLTSDLFKDLPELKFVIPHGGGAVPYHWGRFRGLADMLKRPPLDELLLDNVFFDTCVYHQRGRSNEDLRGQRTARLSAAGIRHRPLVRWPHGSKFVAGTRLNVRLIPGSRFRW